MYYFAEFFYSGNNNYCFAEDLANTAESHVQKVMRGAGGNWRPYRDGTWQGGETTWTACGGNACEILAQGENRAGGTGYWQAKFSGTDNTPWQFYNGTIWSTINSAGTEPNPMVVPWSGPGGTFPDGLWWFIYDQS